MSTQVDSIEQAFYAALPIQRTPPPTGHFPDCQCSCSASTPVEPRPCACWRTATAQVRRSARGPGANLAALGELEVEKVLHEVMEQALATADRSAAAICLGIAGVDRAEDAAIIRGIMRRIGNKAPVLVVNDALIALEAGAGDGPGIVVIAGTGSICYGRNERGQAARAGGWGYILADEGSGWWIGQRAMQAVMRQADGRGPATAADAARARAFRRHGAAIAGARGLLSRSAAPPDRGLGAAVQASVDEGDAGRARNRRGRGRGAGDAAALGRRAAGDARRAVSRSCWPAACFACVPSLLADVTSALPKSCREGSRGCSTSSRRWAPCGWPWPKPVAARGFPRTSECREQESSTSCVYASSKDEDAVARAVASRVAALVAARPDAVLGLPTGRTPVRLYAELRELAAAGEIDFSRVTTFNLDEFLGLPCRPSGQLPDVHGARTCSGTSTCRAGASIPQRHGGGRRRRVPALRGGNRARPAGIDLQILGIGANGHIGFNEPARSGCGATRTARACRPGRGDRTPICSAAVPRDVPREALSMGVGTILRSRAGSC